MPDIGVLSLQIQENSESAIRGLDNLVGALGRVRDAAANGLKLTSVATGIKNIASAVNEKIQDSTIVRIGKLVDELKKLNGVGNVHIKITGGDSFRSVLDAAQETREALSGINTGFDDIAPRSAQIRDKIAAEDTREIDKLRETLEAPIDYSNIQAYIDQVTGVSAKLSEVEEKTVSAFNIPAMDSTGAFKYASDELYHYMEQLNKAKSDMEFWANEYDRIQKRIKYNGATDERTNALGHAEEGFYRASEAIDQYSAKIAELRDYINKMADESAAHVAEASQEAASAVSQNAQDVKASVERIASATMRLQKTGPNTVEYMPHTMEETAAERMEALAIKQENQARREAVWANETSDRMQAAQESIYRVREAADSATQSVQNLNNALSAQGGNTIGQVVPEAGAVDATAQSMTNYADVMRDVDTIVNRMSSDNAQMITEAAALETQINNLAGQELMLRDALAQDIQAGLQDADVIATRAAEIRNLQTEQANLYAQLLQMGHAEGQATSATYSLRDALRDLRDGMNNLPFVRLLKQMARMAKMRALRYMIRELAKGFREGVENMYHYSETIGGGFANSMDGASTALSQMKNSIGAMAAPLLQMLIPALQSVVNWVIEVVNWLNQFFALMSGNRTWTRALPVATKAFDSQEKAAKKAGNAIKDLLADWDELNIIQSQTGGAGAGVGSSAAEEYLNMFEEVSVFDGKIRKIVDYIKDNFDDILQIAKEIGAAILLWKISTAFAGIIGQLAALAGAIYTLKLVFDISTEFTDRFLDTGDPGWLVGDVLATLLGGLFTKALLTLVLGRQAATIAIPLVFIVSAGATIIANIRHTDISALSQESLLADATAALEGSVAGATLGYMVGHNLGSALAGGAVGLLGTFGVAIGIKADAQVSAEGITPENIAAKLISVASLGLTGAMLGARLAAGAGVSTGAAAAGMSMLFSGVPIATFGVSIGINAVNKVVDGGEITEDVIRDNFLSGGLIGAGLFLSTTALVGTTVGGIVAVGGAGIAIAALFGIEATIAEKANKVEWGNYKATKEEIETFVNEELFKDPPDVTISLINATIEPLGDTKSRLESDAEAMLGTLYAYRLGTLTTVDDLKAQIDALVEDFNTASEQYQNTLQVALSLVPVKGDDGEDKSAEIIKNSSERWSALNTIMTDLGNQLADAYSVAYDARLSGNIDRDAEETIKKLSNMMSRVASAITTGQARAQVAQAIRDQIDNLSQDTLGGILDEYEAQRNKLIEELTSVRKDSAEGVLAQYYAFEELAKYALKDAGNNLEDETYKYYKGLADQAKADYDTLMANLQKDVEDSVDKLADEETIEKLRSFLLGILKNSFDENDVEGALSEAGYQQIDEYLKPSLQQMLREALEFDDTSGMEAEVQELFDKLLMELVGADNFEEFKKSIEQGIIKYGDLFSDTFMQNLRDTLGISEMGPEAQQIWDDIIANMFGTNPSQMSEPIEEVQETINETKDAIEETTEAASGLQDKLEDIYDGTDAKVEDVVQDSGIEQVDMPEIDNSDFIESVEETVQAAEDASEQIQAAIGDVWFDRDNNIHVQLPEELSNDAWTYIKMIENAMNSGKGLEEIQAANDQALAMFGVDAFIEALPYIQNMTEKWKEMNGVLGDVDITGINSKTNAAASSYEDMASRIRGAFRSLDGIGFSMSLDGMNGTINVQMPAMTMMATGGFPRSGDLVMANENGEFEMMGRMGNQPVVANNQQIVEGISNGVSNANEDVVSELRGLGTLMRQIINTGLVAKVVPSSSMGRNNNKSAEAYDRVTG